MRIAVVITTTKQFQGWSAIRETFPAVCYPFLNGVTDRCQFWCQFVLEFRALPCAGVHQDCV